MTPQDRLFKVVIDEARSRWGRGWDMLSREQQRAAYAEGFLYMLAQQDDAVDPAVVTQLMRDAWAWLVENT